MVILDQNNNLLEEYREFIGMCTNNQAEYRALIEALNLAARYCKEEVYCFLDSELIIRQMNGLYRLKNDKLRELYHKVKDRERPFKRVRYTHMSDTDPCIKKAHKLAHEALNDSHIR